MAEKKIKWTRQQRLAITQRGSDVLVTASAGTGKTAVLSGRCVDIVSDKSICPDIWSVLVLTFTDAAAEQMRLRIAEQLKAEFLKNKDRHLRHQLMLLAGSDISTIHSFCKRLITEHFYKLSLDPTFRVIDSDEQRLLKAEILDKTIDWAWQQGNLRAGLEQLLIRRDLRTNDGFLSNIISLSNFLDSIVSRQDWYQRALLLAGSAGSFESELGQKQKQMIAEKLHRILNQLRHAQKLCKSQSTNSDWPDKLQDSHIKPVKKCLEFLVADDWDKFVEFITNFKKPPTRKPKDVSEPIDELIRKTARGALEDFASLLALAIVNPEYTERIGRAAGLQTKIVIELVKKFDRLYTQAKQAINCLDFADLEHYALQLLTDGCDFDDNPVPSETALALRRKYKYIFVDEYQDINTVQQEILNALSCKGNVFVVGDVKQSIYAFRGAKPEIFLEHLTTASVNPANAPNGLRVDLTANWRSAKGILDFVNKVFSRIMSASFVGIDYDNKAMLQPGPEERTAKQTSDEERLVELHILDEKARDEGQGTRDEGRGTRDEEQINVYSSRQRQAAMIAQRIRQMVGADSSRAQFQIYDKVQDRYRDVEYRDIVILMRSPARRANDYVEVLRLAAVPVICAAATGYFETTEITDCLSLLKVLDNPQRDIELAAVLRSPFFNITDSELAKIKIHSEPLHDCKNFYESVLRYSDSGPDTKLADRLKEIFAQIEQWRTLGRRGNLAEMIWQIYRRSGFLSYVSALPNGQARRANLLKLHDRAIQFEGFASSRATASLRRFVEFIERLSEAGQDWAPAEPETAAQNAVRIISVHKSKGLEFPVVFLAELDGRFNRSDFQADFLADTTSTLGLRIIDGKSNTRLSSLAHQVIAEQKQSTSLAEEMRILYVATTRARDRLILSASKKTSRCRDIICNGFSFGDEPIPGWQLRRCQSPAEWILYGLSDQKSLHTAFETGSAEKANDDDLFSVKLYGQTELKQLCEYIIRLKRSKRQKVKAKSKKVKGDNQLSIINNRLNWRYRFGDAPFVPAKLSVTQLTHRSDEYIKFDYSGVLQRQPKVVLPAEPGEGQLIGTATHLVIAQLDLAGPVTGEAIEKIKEKLVADAALAETVAALVDTDSIMGFFQSKLGQLALDAYSEVCCEWLFSFTVPASQLQSDVSCNDETIVVQGIIDMLVQTPKGLLVIDFKTDNITAGQAPERAEIYREQLELYSGAAEAILKSEMAGKWLYFLAPGCAVEVK